MILLREMKTMHTLFTSLFFHPKTAVCTVQVFLSHSSTLCVSSGFCGGRPLLLPEWRGNAPFKL